MKIDRFLQAILAGIFVLIITAIVVFFTRSNQVVYVEGSEPTDVVHNYVVAIQIEEYEKAYGYLATMQNKPTFAEFTTTFNRSYNDMNLVGVELGYEKIIGSSAVVELIIVGSNFGPFSTGYRSSGNASLILQNGEWKISNMPSELWGWDWYQDIGG